MTLEEISVQDAHRDMDGYAILDVRGAGEFDGPLGRIEGSQLLPLPELSDRAEELPGAVRFSSCVAPVDARRGRASGSRSRGSAGRSTWRGE